MMHCNQDCKLIDKFSLIQKVFMRLGLYGALIIGAYSIYVQSFMWGIIYTIFIILGIFPFLACFCSHRPYPYEYSDCLFSPHEVVKSIFKYRPGPMNIIEKVVIILITAGLILIPQYWLFKNYTLLIIFWLFCALMVIPAPLYFCKRCRYFHCPLNMTKKEAMEGRT